MNKGKILAGLALAVCLAVLPLSSARAQYSYDPCYTWNGYSWVYSCYQPVVPLPYIQTPFLNFGFGGGWHEHHDHDSIRDHDHDRGHGGRH